MLLDPPVYLFNFSRSPRTPPITERQTVSASGNINQSQRHDSKTPPKDFRIASQTFEYPPLKHRLPTPLGPSKNPPKTPCGHENSGQELCYLCHQRQTRNIPVDFTEERKRREREEEMLLSQYQEMKNTEAFLKQQVRGAVSYISSFCNIDVFSIAGEQAGKATRAAEDGRLQPGRVRRCFAEETSA